MNIEEARLYLEHTSKDDFNLEEHQKENRYQAIQVVLKEIERLKADLHEANDSVTWWNNRYNAIVKQNDDNHKKLVKEQEKIEKAIKYINWVWNNTNKPTNTIVALRTLENILQGVDKE